MKPCAISITRRRLKLSAMAPGRQREHHDRQRGRGLDQRHHVRRRRDRRHHPGRADGLDKPAEVRREARDPDRPEHRARKRRQRRGWQLSDQDAISGFRFVRPIMLIASPSGPPEGHTQHDSESRGDAPFLILQGGATALPDKSSTCRCHSVCGSDPARTVPARALPVSRDLPGRPLPECSSAYDGRIPPHPRSPAQYCVRPRPRTARTEPPAPSHHGVQRPR